MKKYELTIIYHKDTSAERIEEIEAKIREHGKIQNIEDEGVKRVAYPIRDQESGHFKFYNLTMEDSEPAKLSSELNITDEALRHLCVRVSERRH